MKRSNTIEQVLFLIIIAGVFGYALYGSLEFPTQAQTFPWFVALTALVITTVELVLFLLAQRNPEKAESGEDSISAKFGGIFPYLVWLLAYYGAIYVIGMVSASALFVFLFLGLIWLVFS